MLKHTSTAMWVVVSLNDIWMHTLTNHKISLFLVLTVFIASGVAIGIMFSGCIYCVCVLRKKKSQQSHNEESELLSDNTNVNTHITSIILPNLCDIFTWYVFYLCGNLEYP